MMWLIWLGVALVCLAGEALTTALVLASFGLGAAIVAVLSLVVPVPAQIVLFALLSLLLVVAVRPAALRLLPSPDLQLPPAASPGLVGRHALVVGRIDRRQGQISMGGGEFWSARPFAADLVIDEGREVEVVATSGLTALVRPAEPVQQVAAGEVPFGLSPREVEVLHLVASGMTNQQIADALVVSPRTVHHHVSHILDKMGVDSRVDAVRIALERGIVPSGKS